jgi:tetratricopeptide (TPR) repeat protein
LPLARQSAQWLDKYLTTGNVETSDAEQVLITLNNLGNRFRIEEQFDEALRLTRRGLDIEPSVTDPNVRRQRGGLLIGMARIHRDRGALDDALRDYREAVTVLEPQAGTKVAVGQTLTFALALSGVGQTLGGSVSLGRPEEAVAWFQRAFRAVDDLAHQDPSAADSRGYASSAGRPLADLLRRSDSKQALDIYDHVLLHLGEIKNNARFRRDEVRALAGSAYALQSLGRTVEARQRLDAAFSRLAELKLYPAEHIESGAESDDALTALADFEAAQGNVRRAIEIYETLRDKISAGEPKPENRLDDAADVSRLCAALATLYRRDHRAELASEFDSRREKLWAHWEKKLPGNPFVQLELEKLHRP